VADYLPILKRKRATLLSNITRFARAINDTTKGTALEDLEHYRNRLQETLNHLTRLDDSNRGSLIHVESATVVESWEVYIASAKRAIYKTAHAKILDNRLLYPVSASPPLRYPSIHPMCFHSNSQPSTWIPFLASLSLGRVLQLISGVRLHKPMCLTD